MPLSEFLRMARGKLESGQKKPSPTDLSSRPDDELVELVWENGQILMQGQSSRVTRSPMLNNLPLNTPKFRDPSTSRIGKFGAVESILNDISSVVPSGDLDLCQDDEMVHWLSYPMDGALAQDYGYEFLPEISGVTANGMSTQNSFVSVAKRSSCDQTVSNLHSGGSTFKGSSDYSRARPLYSRLPHRQTSDTIGSGISDIISNNTSSYPDAVFGNPGQGRGIVNDSTNTKMERQNIRPPSNLLNFSHFSRPATLVKANLQKSDRIPTSVSSGVKIIEAKEKGLTASGSNPVKSAIFDLFNSAQKESGIQVSSANVSMVNSRQPLVKTPKEPCPPEKTDNFCREISSANDKPLNLSNNTANSIKGIPDCEKTVEPVAASSSVGSGNSADRTSCEQTHNSKRKFRDTEESECHSDEIETESVGVKKPTPGRGGTGSKRSRAAEVHNLSERRRRDRINEKMRALQELIPNCNKADKASMLDEAIEYLKTLQLQVQIMSMGAGLCMPPMMFPTGMQHMHPAHVPHFPPMGVGMGMGMGMGMGYGMGMVDMNGGSPGCPIFPVPHFPSPMSGPTNFQRIPGPNLPVFGHPRQGIPTSVPRPPLVPLNTRLPVSSAVGTSASRNGNHNEVHNASPILNSGDTMTNIKSQLMDNVGAGSSANHRSDKVQVTNEALDQPATVLENKQATDGGTPAAPTATTATDISKGPGYD